MSELMLSKQTLIKLLERASPDPCENVIRGSRLPAVLNPLPILILDRTR